MTENPLRREYWLGTVDPRPLALFRLLFGTVVLCDLLQRIPDVRVFLSDEGFAQRATSPWLSASWSLSRLAGSPPAVMMLYLAGCASVAAFLVGYRTRLAQVAMFVFLASLRARNPNFLGALGQDRVMKTMSFWLLFADSGAVWSLDWILKRRVSGAVPAIGLRLLQWQVGLILLFAGLPKWATWTDGLAFYRFLQVRAFATPLGATLLAWPALCSALTWLVLPLELMAPLLLIPLAPLAPSWIRAAGILVGSSLFLGILAFLEVGCFPELMLSGLVLFVLPEWLDRQGWIAPTDPAATAPSTRRCQSIVAVVGLAQLGLATWSLIAPAIHIGEGRLLRDELRLTSLRQEWAMFVQTKGLSSEWWSDLGTLADGRRQEVLEGTVPGLVVGPSPERHWELLRFQLSRSPELRRAMVNYACRELDRTSPIPLATLELDLHELPVTDPGEQPRPETVRVFHEPCGQAPGG